jgi:hypothetical protein
MSRTLGLKYFGLQVGALAAVMLLAPSCTAVQRYSRSTAETACASFDRCTVYDDAGRHEVACFQPAGETSTASAGDAGWPITTASCRPG